MVSMNLERDSETGLVSKLHWLTLRKVFRKNIAMLLASMNLYCEKHLQIHLSWYNHLLKQLSHLFKVVFNTNFIFAVLKSKEEVGECFVGGTNFHSRRERLTSAA